MPGFDGTGPNGMGPMTGGGRGFCVVRGGVPPRYSFPQRMPYSFPRYGAYGFGSFTTYATREQELEFLKSQAQALRNELKELETEIGKLSAEKK